MLVLFRPIIRSRHPSHSILRRRNSKVLPLLPFKSLVRFGSITTIKDTVSEGGDRIEINTVEAVKNSSNKLKMKQCFDADNIISADWIHTSICSSAEFDDWFNSIKFPVISKSLYGSRNNGNVKHDTLEGLEKWMKNRDLKNYIFEKFYNYAREYRLHVTEDGCFYTCRKMLKQGTPDKDKWFRNDTHCVWIMEENDSFDKPCNWDKVVKESVKALNAVGLDMGAVDLKIQSAKTEKGNLRKDPSFIVIEINSAPSFGDITQEKYTKQIPIILKKKYDGN
jgi:glutathione synthase/RimK-type ligase-like ATP-grasp enzyme